MVIQRCTKGLWDANIPNIEFDEQGVSNFCLLQEDLMKQYPLGEQGRKDWNKIVDDIKSAGKGKRYDCIVGVSGGVDSSFLLHTAHQFGLRPLAVNLDNGFNSEIAVQNIFKVTSKLNIDLETYVIDYEEIKDLLRSYMKASLPWADAPTDLAIKAVMYKYAVKENIKFIIRGNDFRSEGKQPLEWTYADSTQLLYVQKKFGSGIKLKTYPLLLLPKMIYAGFFKGIRDIRPFYYLDYNKQEAKRKLIEEYKWQDYGGHHQENLFTKYSMAYWLPKKFNIDKRIINLSAQILSGVISREEGMRQLEQPFDTEENLLKLEIYVKKKLEISDAEYQKIFESDNKFYDDYPSQHKFIYSNLKYFSWLIKRMFAFKPMSISTSKFIKMK